MRRNKEKLFLGHDSKKINQVFKLVLKNETRGRLSMFDQPICACLKRFFSSKLPQSTAYIHIRLPPPLLCRLKFEKMNGSDRSYLIRPSALSPPGGMRREGGARNNGGGGPEGEEYMGDGVRKGNSSRHALSVALLRSGSLPILAVFSFRSNERRRGDNTHTRGKALKTRKGGRRGSGWRCLFMKYCLGVVASSESLG